MAYRKKANLVERETKILGELALFWCFSLNYIVIFIVSFEKRCFFFFIQIGREKT